MTITSLRAGSAAIVVALAVSACTGEPPSGIQPLEGNTLSVQLPVIYQYQPQVGEVKVCKFGTDADFTASASGPGQLLATDFSLPISGCSIIWLADVSQAGDATVTITEHVPAGFTLVRIAVLEAPAGTTTNLWSPANDQVTVTANATTGYALWFKNEGAPPPPVTEGCTPGYWKQTQHFDSWPSPYTPSTLFSDVFDDAFSGLTLLEVLKLGKGDLNALGRHSVAAFLNASAGLDYGMTATEVVDAFNAAYASGDAETTKDQFEALNEAGCSLD